MISETDINKLIVFCERFLKLQCAKLDNEYFYRSLSLCVIDAVYSIGVSYEGTRNTVIKYCRYYDLPMFRTDRNIIPAIEDQEPIAAFVEKIKSRGIEYFTSKVFDNRQRTSATNGILKADAVLRFAKILLKYNVNYFQDVQSLSTNDDFEHDIKTIPGQNSGISLKYFFMLAGSDDLIKPDRWIKKFLNGAIHKHVSDQDAQKLLFGACEKLKITYPNLTPRLLDNVIWEYERNKDRSRKRTINRGKFCDTNAKNNEVPVLSDDEGECIRGRIVSPDTDRLEITIYKNQKHGLPLKHGLRVPIQLLIEGVAYEAGVRITGQVIPWVCPDVSDSKGQKVRLADALRKAGFEKGQIVCLSKCDANAFNKFKLEHSRWREK